MLKSNGGAKLFGEPRKTRCPVQHSSGFIDHFLAERRNLNCREDCGHIAKRLVERGGLYGLSVEQLGPNGIQNRVTHLVTTDVGAFR